MDAILPGNGQHPIEPASKLRSVMAHTMRRWLQLFVTVLTTSTIFFKSVCAATIPNNPILSGMCQPNQGVSSNSTPVGFTPWDMPPFGYQLSENPRVAMTYTQIYVTADRPYARTEDIIIFVQNFQTELEEHYGRGSEIIPRKVGVKLPDPQSGCNWDMYFESRRFSKPMLTASVGYSSSIFSYLGTTRTLTNNPTKVALGILEIIWRDFKAHGSAAIEIWIAEKVYNYGFAHLTFTFERFGVVQEPGCPGNGSFYVCPSNDDSDASLQVVG